MFCLFLNWVVKKVRFFLLFSLLNLVKDMSSKFLPIKHLSKYFQYITCGVNVEQILQCKPGLRLNVCWFKIIYYIHPPYHPKVKETSQKKCENLIKGTLKAFDNFKNKQKNLWSTVFWYVKVCIFWMCI